MERTANIDLIAWRSSRLKSASVSTRVFALALIVCVAASALFASWVPLQFSIATVFLFAGPHNWFEARYFLMRLPARFGRSRTFFIVAFAGIGFLTLTYISLPALYYSSFWSGENWPTALAVWNTLLLFWIASLVWLRGKQKAKRDWSWAWAVATGIAGLNWLAPELFSLAIVYLHPLVALWFLDRHLRRTRPDWLGTYRRCLILLPLIVAGMCWLLAGTPALADDNGLAWRITQHAGGGLLPGISTHMLVSVHVFLEMLHYGVWLLALPLIGASGAIWSVKTIPIARHPRGFPRLVVFLLAFGLLLVAVLWLGFSTNYAATRDIYFAVAMAHVLAEAPFLLRMI